MQSTGIGTSLMLIAIGAILAFAINFQSSGVDMNAIGAILMVVGLIGLLLSFVALGDFGGFGNWGRRDTSGHDHVTTEPTHTTHTTYVETAPHDREETVREERIIRR